MQKIIGVLISLAISSIANAQFARMDFPKIEYSLNNMAFWYNTMGVDLSLSLDDAKFLRMIKIECAKNDIDFCLDNALELTVYKDYFR